MRITSLRPGWATRLEKREKRERKIKEPVSYNRDICLFMFISILFRTARNRTTVKLYSTKKKNEVIKLAGKLKQLVK